MHFLRAVANLSHFFLPAPRERSFCPARETEPLTMVATGSLSSKNSASISELLDGSYHPGSLLSGESLWLSISSLCEGRGPSLGSVIVPA